jgi:hypothetical protein
MTVNLPRYVSTQHPARNVNGEFPIMPGEVSKVSCDTIVDRPIGEPDAAITPVAAISDQRRRWHKVKFMKFRSPIKTWQAAAEATNQESGRLVQSFVWGHRGDRRPQIAKQHPHVW